MSTIYKKLKAYVRFDGSGRVVAGSLILRKNKPKVGRWQEISAYECCGPIIPPVVVLDVDAFDTVSIDISWAAATVATGQSPVTHYIIKLDTVQQAIIAAADTLAYIYTGLSDDTSYDLTIEACTIDGCTSSAIVQQTTEAITTTTTTTTV